MKPRTTITALAIILVGAIGMPLPALAAPSGESQPNQESLPSLNESEGCDALVGTRGPLADAPGLLTLDEPIYGPWADFYGRTVGDAWNQRVAVQFPGGSTTVYVHQRVMPALQLVLDNLAAEAAAGHTYAVNSWETFSWARYTIPPTRAFSFHAVGAAIDINSVENPYSASNQLITNMPSWFVDAWRNAGWCWGGDWVSIKDTMHFSWKGPLFTPGFVMPPPQPPLVAAAPFSAVIALDVRLGTTSDPNPALFVTDIDRDGAPDVVRIARNATTGKVAVSAAPARNDFHWAESWGTTTAAPTDTGAPVSLADLTHDGRPDLVYVLDGGSDLVSLEVFAHTGGENLPRSVTTTSVPYDSGARYLFDDFDRDGYNDLYVVRPGSPATLEVWRGPAFADRMTTQDLPVGSSDQTFSMGDRDVDGIPDLYALGQDGTLSIFTGTSSYQATLTVDTNINPNGISVQTGDLDGDGHTDLFLVDPQGNTTVRRGGASTHDPGVWYRIRTHRITRLAGGDRYSTAASVSSSHFPAGTVDTVFVATGTDFPDALAGAAMAGRLDAPLLLVQPGGIPPSTAAELVRLHPTTIVILGGEAVVPASVETALDAYGVTVRLAGSNRYDTSVAISEYGFSGHTDEVMIASGDRFADALAGGPAAAMRGGPLLLTAADRLPASVRAEILRLAPSRITVLGGTSAVSQAVFAELQSLAPTTRISGSDRYLTAAALSAAVFPEGADRVYLATGLNFPDALAGAAAAAREGAPLLLVPATTLPSGVRSEITRLKAYDVVILGGTNAVAAAVESAVEILGM